MFGLRDSDIEVIGWIARQHPVIEQIFIYGSRARGTHKHGSDIDLAVVGGGVDRGVISNVHYWLNEESPTPYFYDVLHLDSLKDEALRKEIDRDKRVIYQRVVG